MPLPPLTLAPTPPELPTVPAPVPEQPAHIPNDARLTQWVADLSRSLKDAWVRLNSSVGGIESALSTQTGEIGGLTGRVTALEGRVTAVEGRVTALEQRIADTYVFAQPGALSATPVGEPPLAPLVGLPLRAVRPEVLVEAAVALQTAAGAPGLSLALEHNQVQIAAGGLAAGQTFAVAAFTPPRPLLANDVLAVRVLQVGDAPATGADLVVQLRCR
jgi:hypothetical protein